MYQVETILVVVRSGMLKAQRIATSAAM